jgi:hypothetical protein
MSFRIYFRTALFNNTATQPVGSPGEAAVRQRRHRQLYITFFFYSRTVHLDSIKVLLPIDAPNNYFKRIIKFTLRQLQHVSVLSPSSGSVNFEFAEVTFVKTVH